MDWIYLAEDGDKLQALVNMIMNLMYIGPWIIVIVEE